VDFGVSDLAFVVGVFTLSEIQFGIINPHVHLCGIEVIPPTFVLTGLPSEDGEI